MRTIFHLDLDSFFISVERIIDPSLKGVPVIVGANPEYGRGVVAACSYEAREYGLHSAMPIKQAYKLCPNGIYLHGHHSEYSHFSRAVKHILEKYAPQIEQASIDEFYLDMTGTERIYGNMYHFAKKIQKVVDDKLSLPISIGIASNKTIAKICSDYAKPNGITYVIPGMEKDFLAPLPVETIPGVGRVFTKNLNEKGFYKIGDITRVSEEFFGVSFGKAGIALWAKAHGKGKDYLNPPTHQKSISKERTYGKDEMNKEKMEATLFNLTGQVCQILRDKNWQASTISLKLRYSDFITITRDKTIKPSDDDKTIYNTLLGMFHKNYTRRVSIRLIGVKVTKFSEYSEQEILFHDQDTLRKKMFRAVTKIRDQFGYESIKFGLPSKNNSDNPDKSSK